MCFLHCKKYFPLLKNWPVASVGLSPNKVGSVGYDTVLICLIKIFKITKRNNFKEIKESHNVSKIDSQDGENLEVNTRIQHLIGMSDLNCTALKNLSN